MWMEVDPSNTIDVHVVIEKNHDGAVDVRLHADIDNARETARHLEERHAGVKTTVESFRLPGDFEEITREDMLDALRDD